MTKQNPVKRNQILHYAFGILVLFSFSLASAQNTAMYGAEGWAATTFGGKGGTIIRVTNLNASGTGSFADALKKSGTRIVVFEVGGVINLNGGNINITQPHLTVAGQTAPSPGITLINGKLNISTHDVILQHISIRPGASGHETGWEPDGLSTVAGYNVIIDHCSFSWAVDENCSASGDRFNGANVEEWRMHTSHDVTLSNNIIAEGLAYATHSKGLHSMGSLIHDNVTNVAILRNLYSCNNARNPLFKAGAMGVVVNNYIYNPGSSGVRYGFVASEWDGHDIVKAKISVVGNSMQLGPSSKVIPFMQATNSPCFLYMNNNIAKNAMGNDLQQYLGDASNLVSEKPIWNDNITVMKATDTKEYVLNHAGARPWDRDAIDARIVTDARNRTGSIINFETEVGGYPTYEPTSASFDKDQWNFDYMIKIAPEIQLSLDALPETLFTNSQYQISAEINDTAFAHNFVELLANGISLGKCYQKPYNWDFQPSNTGEYTIVVVAETMDFDLRVSKSMKVMVQNQSATSRIEVLSESKSDLALNSYPNPFNKSTTIKYDLSENQYITISICNATGQVVEVLRNGVEIAGKHRINWSPQNLPDGLYFIQLVSENGVFYHKVLYTKR